MYVAVLQFATSQGWKDDDAFPFESRHEALAAATYKNMLLCESDDHNMRYAVKPMKSVPPENIRIDLGAAVPKFNYPKESFGKVERQMLAEGNGGR